MYILLKTVLKLEAGLKTSYVKTDNQVEYLRNSGGRLERPMTGAIILCTKKISMLRMLSFQNQ